MSESRIRIRTIKKMKGDGQYFTMSQSVLHWGCMGIILFIFKLPWYMIKYTIGLPFILMRKSKKNR